MKKLTLKPTEKELSILQVLWKYGPSTVREINEKLSVAKKIGYTTTLKLMQIMFEKGILSRERNGKNHIYIAELTQENTQKRLLNKLLEGAFEGSAMKLVMQALGNGKSSKEELEEIRKYLDELEGGKS